ncbi:MAG: alpha/beta hydrolase-fold protein [Rubricoccaceae bacterium]
MRPALVCLLLGVSASALAQPLSVPESETFALDGPSGTYEITVTLPPGYDASSPERYPTLYALDGWWLREMVTGIARVAAISSQTNVQPVVLVSIGLDGDEDAWTTQRNRDLTPSPYQSPVPGMTMSFGGIVLDSAGTGGAAAFLAFLMDDLFPRVEAGYRADPAQRGILGHSFGGLFGAWMLGHQPEVFDRYLLISPSTWWRAGEVMIGGFAEARQLDRRVFLAVGEAEDRILTRGVDAFRDALATDAVAITQRMYPDATHTSVLPRAIWDGFVALYGQPDAR